MVLFASPSTHSARPPTPITASVPHALQATSMPAESALRRKRQTPTVGTGLMGCARLVPEGILLTPPRRNVKG